MSQTVELPDDLANALNDEASRLGLSLPDYAIRLLTTARPFAVPIHDGAELVAFWQAEGVVGSRKELVDIPSEDRHLRDQAQRRGK